MDVNLRGLAADCGDGGVDANVVIHAEEVAAVVGEERLRGDQRKN
jgi:hypothetical protein